MALLLGLAILLFSAILHEIMHGLVADKLGDPTARLMGRLTLNPIPHLDPILSIALPAILILSGSPIIFGAAKPVPINPMHFREPKKDMALSGLAGPLTNMLIAIVAGLIFKLFFSGVLSLEQGVSLSISGSLGFSSFESIFIFFLSITVLINLILAIINLIPIPPLDGSRVLTAFLPNDLARGYLSIEPFGIFILFFLLFFPIGDFSLGNFLWQTISYAIQLLG